MTSAYFVDSSALVKRYVHEIGSEWLQTITQPDQGHFLIVSRTTWVEVISAFARLQREAHFNISDITAAIQIFRYDWHTQYQVVELDEGLALKAGELVQQYPLRAYDSIQLAAALKLIPVLSRTSGVLYSFVSADSRLLATAQAEGLSVDNPNDYP